MAQEKTKSGSVSQDYTEMASLKHWGDMASRAQSGRMERNVFLECGWGRLLFGQTYRDSERLSKVLQEERSEERDVALYVREPHVVLSLAPHALFLDPSHTFRLALGDFEPGSISESEPAFTIRAAEPGDEAAIDEIYRARQMVPVGPDYIGTDRQPASVQILIAEDPNQRGVVGVVMGVDHVGAFNDPDNGSSLWALAVHTQAKFPGIGRGLVEALAQNFQHAGRQFMDLSVIHTNKEAIQLYHRLGFTQIPVYCVKKKNKVNEKLFIGPASKDKLNPYAQIIVDEARRRGVGVDIEDADAGLFKLTLGGRSICCRESLTDLTSAVALSRCDDKSLTYRLLKKAGYEVPAQLRVKREREAREFLKTHQHVVVKPAQGEQGRGVYVNLSTEHDVISAVRAVKDLCDTVLIEEYVEGQDLRIIVIGGDVVAAAVRRPATIVGDGIHTIIELIDKQSRRRAAATRGESRIPMDAETERCVEAANYQLLDILPKDQPLEVRRTANLHTGGTMHDVTNDLNPVLATAARETATLLHMPVIGLDMIVEAPDKPKYRIIEVNERPGLANHEPAPTVSKFMDLLFPDTIVKPEPAS